MTRQGAVAAVLVLVLVSGCLGLTGGETTPGQPVESPAPTTPTPQVTPTPTPTSTPEPTLPAGWSESGVEDPNTALRSHYSAVLDGPSATVAYRSSVLKSDRIPERNTTLAVTLEPTPQRMHLRIDGAASSLEVFYADGTLTRWDAENGSVAGQSEMAYQRAVQSADIRVLKSQLLLYRLQLTDTVERDGTTVFVYNVSDVYSAASRTYGVARNGTGRVLVSADGRVRDIDATVTYTNGTVAYRYTHMDLGETTVETPEWATR